MSVDHYLSGLTSGKLSMPKPPAELDAQFKSALGRAIAIAEAALKQLLSTADAFKGTEAGTRARYYAASLYAETNRPKEAAEAYTAVRDQAGASTLLGRMASLGLASMQVRQKQFEPAIKALQELSQRRDGPLPVDAVLVQLADAYQQAGRSAEASQTSRSDRSPLYSRLRRLPTDPQITPTHAD